MNCHGEFRLFFRLPILRSLPGPIDRFRRLRVRLTTLAKAAQMVIFRPPQGPPVNKTVRTVPVSELASHPFSSFLHATAVARLQ